MALEPTILRPDGWALPGNRWDLLDGLTPDAPPSVSVIVAYYQQPDQLARLLRALDRQDHPADGLEIIVVDDGSAAPPVVPAHVRLLGQEDHGFRLAAARNLGAAAARNDVLVFLDADTAPEPAYLRRLCRLPALSWDCVVVGRRRHADLADTPFEADIEQAGPAHELPEPAWLVEGYRRTRDLLDADDRSYRYVIGAVIGCSRRFFAETGGFDETFVEYGGEDWEWVYRAWLRGAVLAHVPAAVAWHDGAFRGRDSPGVLAAKNAEAVRLAELIPVAGSRGRSGLSGRVDVAVIVSPGPWTPGQRFVSIDSVVSAIPGSAPLPETADPGIRFDRVRLDVIIECPLTVAPGALDTALDTAATGGYGEIAVHGADGTPLLTIVSRRAAARQARWGGSPMLSTLQLIADGVTPLVDEVDVEAYIGGWG